MSAYALTDSVIQQWVRRSRLTLFTEWAGGEARFAYLSSNAGECFQISIAPPKDGTVDVSIGCVEGETDCEPPVTRSLNLADLETGLDDVLKEVIARMGPSGRYFP